MSGGGTRRLWREAADLAAPHGYRLVKTGTAHAKLVHPHRRPIPVPSSPSIPHEYVLVIIRQTIRRAERDA